MSYLPFNVHDVSAACKLLKYSVSGHARKRLGERKMCAADLVSAMAYDCEVIETYPDRPQGYSALVLSQAPNRRWLHAVCALSHEGILLIVTFYEPEPPDWVDERTRGVKQGESR